jgi:hypothetical protein
VPNMWAIQLLGNIAAKTCKQCINLVVLLLPDVKANDGDNITKVLV